MADVDGRDGTFAFPGGSGGAPAQVTGTSYYTKRWWSVGFERPSASGIVITSGAPIINLQLGASWSAYLIGPRPRPANFAVQAIAARCGVIFSLESTEVTPTDQNLREFELSVRSNANPAFVQVIIQPIQGAGQTWGARGRNIVMGTQEELFDSDVLAEFEDDDTVIPAGGIFGQFRLDSITTENNVKLHSLLCFIEVDYLIDRVLV